MLRCTVREPNPWSGCIHEQESAEDDSPACPDCGEPSDDGEDGKCSLCRCLSEDRDEVAPI